MKSIRVKIYSVERQAFWRANQQGYTSEINAGVWTLEDMPIRVDAVVLSLHHLELTQLAPDAHIAIMQN